MKVAAPSAEAQDFELAKWLWRVSDKLCGAGGACACACSSCSTPVPSAHGAPTMMDSDTPEMQSCCP
ncbi:hypothetical protein MSG28_006686 [Choristoneura fumiferana]|uniref:Uncharacterized protein n=1 Tax=Choristoneura fumiferana TaxID=7141 RepID=A0ACC0JKQ8_CHOFU|nr:hypothetical protein MSG28_006686 [Choristoneura fumiferana]